MIPKSQYSKAGPFQKSRPIRIKSDLISMLPAIDLNNQFSFQTNEIKYILFERMLSTKFESVKLLAS